MSEFDEDLYTIVVEIVIEIVFDFLSQILSQIFVARIWDCGIVNRKILRQHSRASVIDLVQRSARKSKVAGESYPGQCLFGRFT